MIRRIQAPLTEEIARSLKAGDRVLLTGTIFTARDAGHKRLAETISGGGKLPLLLRDAVIFYVGPTPARPGEVIGSAGPTTSYRMDPYTPLLLAHGLRGMIGKGFRSREVIEAMKEHGAVYFAAVGGAGALLAERITAAEVIAYEDLGAEALRRLEVRDFPLVVAIDSTGRDLYREGPAAYLRQREQNIAKGGRS
ncbi:MAG: Fe-S-containing hydro-lyase [Saccharofermentanales bacterium]|jgi:fumarate hydratase subunit beta|nr:Fe-S-containing hydro-lyase [Bacillota bacterium]NLB09006.1 Fe-S-containing hydro-lyase [Clostridiales bacterium]